MVRAPILTLALILINPGPNPNPPLPAPLPLTITITIAITPTLTLTPTLTRFEGGLPTGIALQPLQLQALRELRPLLPLPVGWKCSACRAVFRECRCPQTRARGHLNPY